MGSAKKYVDLYFDFFLFMMGLIALFAGFNRVYAFQDSTLLSITNSELVYIQDEPRDKTNGADVISMLLSEGNTPVVFNGVSYEKQEVKALLATFDTTKSYTVKRVYDTDKANAPSEIRIHESEE